jgi:hypothetical protein
MESSHRDEWLSIVRPKAHKRKRLKVSLISWLRTHPPHYLVKTFRIQHILAFWVRSSSFLLRAYNRCKCLELQHLRDNLSPRARPQIRSPFDPIITCPKPPETCSILHIRPSLRAVLAACIFGRPFVFNEMTQFVPSKTIFLGLSKYSPGTLALRRWPTI